MRPAEELRLASEHVAYEIERVFGTLLDISGLQLAHSSGEEPSLCTRDALLEAWTIHLRNTMHFLSASNPYPAEILASDYFPGNGWQEVLAEARKGWDPQVLREPEVDESKLDRRINTEIVNLTYDRIHVTSEAKQWQPRAISRQLGRDLQVYVDNVPAQLVGDDFQRRVQASLDSLH